MQVREYFRSFHFSLVLLLLRGTVVLFFRYALFSAKLCTVFVFPTEDPIRTEVYFRLLSVNEDEHVRCQIFCSYFWRNYCKMALLFEYGNIVIFSEECFKYFFLGRNEKKNVNRIMNLYHYVQMLLRDALD